MKDVVKTNVERQNSRKRIRRRNRNKSIYGLIVMLLVLTAGITICYTFLFNVHEIRVSGESDMYTAEEIVAASGIEEGDNLLRLKPGESEQKILDNLLWVETATIERDFPSSVEIKVTRCIPAFYISSDSGVLLVSRKGKILENTGKTSDDYPIIYGYDPSVFEKGRPVGSENQHKQEAFNELMSTLATEYESDISTVDMTDEFSIVVNYKNGMVFKMGTWNDVEYKLNLAENVMNDESVKGKKGYLRMIGTNECSFRMSDEPVEVHEMIEPTKPTDANGEPIETTTVSGESDIGQQKLFDEANNGLVTVETTTAPDYYDDGNDWNEYNDYNDYNNDWNEWNADGGYDNGYGDYNEYDNGEYDNGDAYYNGDAGYYNY